MLSNWEVDHAIGRYATRSQEIGMNISKMLGRLQIFQEWLQLYEYAIVTYALADPVGAYTHRRTQKIARCQLYCQAIGVPKTGRDIQESVVAAGKE